MLLLILIPNIIWANNLTIAKKPSYEEIKQAGLWVKGNSEVSDIVISSSYPQIAYYSERTTYSFSEIMMMKSNNYTFSKKGNPSDDEQILMEKYLHEYVLEEKPRYLVLSAIQKSQD